MNPSLDTPSTETPSLGSAPGTSPESQQQRDDNPILGKYRGNGKVARLPKNVRDQINQGILDGLSYPNIIERLGEQGAGLNPDHLHEWKKRGYQDWLVQQDWLAERRARMESAADFTQDSDPTHVNQGALQLGTLYIFEALRDLRAGVLDDKLGGDLL